ncbi:MAG: two-component sensor histidine kinase [Anaerolineae bacterium]|nr:two-component sensor histidine kinase [Gloeobacterales cyanobacterium ES-bin-313]
MLKPLFQKTRLQLALAITGAMGAIVLGASLGFYGFMVQQQYGEVDRDLENLSQTLLGGIESHDGDRDDNQPIQIDLEHVPFLGSETRASNFPRGYLRWYATTGHLRKSVGSANGLTPHFPRPGIYTIAGQPTYRVRTVTVEGGFLELGLSLAPVEEELARIGLVLVCGVPLVLGAVGLTGWWLAGQAMVPIERSYTQLQQFTADASHELRTPLAVVRANAQAALRQPLLDETQTREKLAAIDRTSVRMGELVSDLLFLARSDNATLPKTDQPCLLNEMLMDLHEELAPMALEAHVQLEVLQESRADVILLGEREQLYRLFINLIANAIKYTPAGGSVKVILQVVGRQAVVSVQDTGIGIPVAHQLHIFERFYQVDQARNRKVGGYGLGLAICQAIVQSHRGTIELTRSSDTGSVFTVRLPLTTSPQSTSGAMQTA